jgi:hypothetical protein
VFDIPVIASTSATKVFSGSMTPAAPVGMSASVEVGIVIVRQAILGAFSPRFFLLILSGQHAMPW